jgi:hypothetical protein
MGTESDARSLRLNCTDYEKRSNSDVGLYRKHCFSGLLPLGWPYQNFDDQQLFTSNSIDTTVLHLKRSNLLSSQSVNGPHDGFS